MRGRRRWGKDGTQAKADAASDEGGPAPARGWRADARRRQGFTSRTAAARDPRWGEAVKAISDSVHRGGLVDRTILAAATLQ